MKVMRYILSFLLLGTLVVGCIKEDLDDCLTYSVNILSLSYKGDGTTEIFNEKIGKVVLYVFDTEDRFVASKELTADELSSRNVVLPELKPDSYRVVCLGNAHNSITNDLKCGDCDRMYFAAEEYFSGKPIPGNDSLYYASLSLKVTEENSEQTLLFASSHYKVVVEVEGVPSGSLPSVEICGVSPRTTFENQAGGEPTDYVLEMDYKDGMLSSRTNIMRHTNHGGVDVCVRASDGTLLAKVNLADFLAAHPTIDCTKHEVLIPIHFEFKSAGVEVTVPDWYVENVKPEF